jgi:sec-independent protein translocase protein TatB
MFDIGWGELVVIGIVALIVIGPKELPTVMRTAGEWMGKIRRMASEFQGQFHEAMREAEMVEIKKQAEDLKDSVTSSVAEVTRFFPVADIGKDIEKSFETSAPTESAALPEPPPPAIDVPPPELPAPVTEKDFAPEQAPPSKQGTA